MTNATDESGINQLVCAYADKIHTMNLAYSPKTPMDRLYERKNNWARLTLASFVAATTLTVPYKRSAALYVLSGLAALFGRAADEIVQRISTRAYCDPRMQEYGFKEIYGPEDGLFLASPTESELKSTTHLRMQIPVVAVSIIVPPMGFAFALDGVQQAKFNWRTVNYMRRAVYMGDRITETRRSRLQRKSLIFVYKKSRFLCILGLKPEVLRLSPLLASFWNNETI